MPPFWRLIVRFFNQHFPSCELCLLICFFELSQSYSFIGWFLLAPFILFVLLALLLLLFVWLFQVNSFSWPLESLLLRQRIFSSPYWVSPQVPPYSAVGLPALNSHPIRLQSIPRRSCGSFLLQSFCSDGCSNSFGHGGCQTFELLHLDAGPGVGDQSFQFYKAGRMTTSHASVHNVPHFNNV